MSAIETTVLALLIVMLEWQRQATGRTVMQMWGWIIAAWIAVSAAQFFNRMALAYLTGFIGGGQ